MNTEPITIYVKTLCGDLLSLMLPPAYSAQDLARLAYEADAEQFPMPQTTFFPLTEEGRSLLDLRDEDMIGAVVSTGIVRLKTEEEVNENRTAQHHLFRIRLSEDTHEHVFESYAEEEFEEDLLRLPVTLRVTRGEVRKEVCNWMEEPTQKDLVYYRIVIHFHREDGIRSTYHEFESMTDLMKDTEPFGLTLHVPSKGFCDVSFCLQPASLQFICSLLPAEWMNETRACPPPLPSTGWLLPAEWNHV